MKFHHLKALGHEPFVPHLSHYLHINGPVDYGDFWLEYDLTFLDRWAEAIYMLEGWENSKGSVKEHERALLMGLPIYYEHYHHFQATVGTGLAICDCGMFHPDGLNETLFIAPTDCPGKDWTGETEACDLCSIAPCPFGASPLDEDMYETLVGRPPVTLPKTAQPGTWESDMAEAIWVKEHGPDVPMPDPLPPTKEESDDKTDQQ